MQKPETWMTEDHAAYAETVRRVLADHLLPHKAEWDAQGMISREFWAKAGEMGLVGAAIPEEYGGSGLPQSFDATTFLEHARTGDSGWGIHVHNFVMHYILRYGTEDQKHRWLPGLASGQKIAAIAMTEPGGGSDLKAVRTSAVKSGNEYVLNGSKTFISNGQLADLVLLVTKTDSAAGSKGVSLIVVETERADGFRRGRNLEKIGMKRQDTSELFFDDCRVPQTNLLGSEEGQGFYQLMNQLDWERLAIGIGALGACECALDHTRAYVRERRAFGQRIMDFQNTRFKLAEAATRTEVLRAFLGTCLQEYEAGTLTADRAAMVKYWATETQCTVIDECLQLHGGYGYMMEYPIAELYADARVQKIYGGTNEIMKDIIARRLDRD